MAVATPPKTREGWLDVDRAGLGSLLERRGREFALYELIQNAWDQNVTRCDVTVEPIDDGYCSLVVSDDDPEGFVTLTDAYTVFAPSRKRGDVEKRGRFNLGEKLVLAICRQARVISTKGYVTFAVVDGKDVRTTGTEWTTDTGSRFEAEIAMTAEQLEHALAELRCLIPPAGIVTTINGEILKSRSPLLSWKQQLGTEADDAQGVLRRCLRLGTITTYEPLDGETPRLYEMGIPVCESGNRWHVEISIKIPLTIDRENVPAPYLSTLNAMVANKMFEYITSEDAAKPWVNDALASPIIRPEATKAIITAKFGEGAVAYDPSDREANMVATDRGLAVIHGSTLSKDQWNNVRKAREEYGATSVLAPAGRVMPSPRPFVDGTEAPKWVENPTPDQRRFVAYAQWLHQQLLGATCEVSLIDDRKWGAPDGSRFAAAYGWQRLYVNVHPALFANGYPLDLRPDSAYANALLLHEFAHAKESNHLSERFHNAICNLAAQLRTLPAYTDVEAEANPVPTSAADKVEAA